MELQLLDQQPQGIIIGDQGQTLHADAFLDQYCYQDEVEGGDYHQPGSRFPDCEMEDLQSTTEFIQLAFKQTGTQVLSEYDTKNFTSNMQVSLPEDT